MCHRIVHYFRVGFLKMAITYSILLQCGDTIRKKGRRLFYFSLKIFTTTYSGAVLQI